MNKLTLFIGGEEEIQELKIMSYCQTTARSILIWVSGIISESAMAVMLLGWICIIKTLLETSTATRIDRTFSEPKCVYGARSTIVIPTIPRYGSDQAPWQKEHGTQEASTQSQISSVESQPMRD